MAGYTAGTSYRQEPELVCSFSQFPTALGLRPGLRELLHRKRETRPNTTYLELGTLGEYITLELLRRLDPRWNQAVPAVPAYLPRDRRGLPCGQYCGCADLLLCTEEVLAVGEAKLLCTREMPLGEEVPADYRCQMEPEMRSNHLHLSYLIVLRFAQLPSKRELKWMRQRLQEGHPVLPVGAELRVWEYRRDERFWDQFVLPGCRASRSTAVTPHRTRSSVPPSARTTGASIRPTAPPRSSARVPRSASPPDTRGSCWCTTTTPSPRWLEACFIATNSQRKRSKTNRRSVGTKQPRRGVHDSCAFWSWIEPWSAQVAVAEHCRDAHRQVQLQELLHGLELLVLGVSRGVDVQQGPIVCQVGDDKNRVSLMRLST
jgi:hypothetical protein